MAYQHSHAPSAIRTRARYTLAAIERRRKTLCGMLNIAEETRAISADAAATALVAVERMAEAILDLLLVVEEIPVGPSAYPRGPGQREGV